MADGCGTKKFKCTVAYDGTAYSGFQTQINAISVQDCIEKSLEKIHKRPVKIYGSGRTDAGVHAKGQVFHFESELAISPARWTKALNVHLKRDIRILDTEEVDSHFHARYDVVKKEYRYYVYFNKIEDPFRRLYSYHVPQPINMDMMERAACLFIGEHDFTAFSSLKTTVHDKVRTIYHLDLVLKGNELTVICEGNGFLYNMVRMIVGTLVAVGRGRFSLSEIKEALTSQNRRFVGPTAPPHGLFLWKVTYEK
jgi:tRNA pseudouridine38-40 synthase